MPRKSINKQKLICAQCKTQILEDEDSMQCDVCEKTLHNQCTKLDKKQIDTLTANLSLEYKCFLCSPTKSTSVERDLGEIKTKLNQLDEIKETIKFMSTQYDTILKGVAKNTKKIEKLEKENNELKSEVRNLKLSVKFLNDNRVRNDCIINGIKTNEYENAIDVVMDLAKKTGANISKQEVEEAYFLNNNATKKSVVVKFVNNKSKKTLMSEKSKLREIEDFKSVYINDFLSRETVQLLTYAKALKSVGYKYIFPKGGNVCAKRDTSSKQIYIKSMEHVDNILCKTVNGASTSTHGKKVIAVDSEDEDDDDDGGSLN